MSSYRKRMDGYSILLPHMNKQGQTNCLNLITYYYLICSVQMGEVIFHEVKTIDCVFNLHCSERSYGRSVSLLVQTGVVTATRHFYLWHVNVVHIFNLILLNALVSVIYFTDPSAVSKTCPKYHVTPNTMTCML